MNPYLYPPQLLVDRCLPPIRIRVGVAIDAAVAGVISSLNPRYLMV